MTDFIQVDLPVLFCGVSLRPFEILLLQICFYGTSTPPHTAYRN